MDTPIALVDSHAHLDMDEFEPDREEVIGRAERAGIAAILCPMELSSEKSVARTLDLLSRHPFLLAAAGIHPHQASLYSDDAAGRLRRLRADGKIAAVGEIGLDFHYDFSPREAQMSAFSAQISVAGELGLPVIVHSRLAGTEVIDTVKASGHKAGGVLHCFTESWEIARAMIELGFLISFSGILTFPKAGDLREVARRIPLDRLLVETDSPFLAPVPMRNRKRNEPAFIAATAEALAGLKGVPLVELAEATTANFDGMFRPARH